MTDELKDLILQMLTKDPDKRITVSQIKVHPWVSCHGKMKMLTESENCKLVTITDDEINSCVTTIPKLYTYVSYHCLVNNAGC